MKLAIQCNKCGNWQTKDTNNIQKALINCFRCGNKKKLKSSKGWNVNFIQLNEILNPVDVIKRLNEKNQF